MFRKDSEKILQEIKDYVESNDLVMTMLGMQIRLEDLLTMKDCR